MVSKKISVFVLAIALILSMTFMASAITGKIGNARVVLYPEVGYFGTTIDRAILVINDNDVEVNVKLQAAENSTLIDIIDEEFVLQPGEQKEAKFEINLEDVGDYEQRVNVFFSPISGTGAGVALSSTIIIHAKGSGSGSDNPDVNDDDSDPGVDLTGYAISLGDFVSEGNNKGLIIVSVSTLVLLAVLIVLLVLSKKKKTAKDVKRKIIKRSDRSS
ncbi:MAG: hypothetical protein ABH840_00240 [Nanoarchaeota archaeon]